MSEKSKSEQIRPETVAAAHGIARDRNFRAVTPPIYLSSTFAFSGYERGGPYDYTRTSNPTRDLLAETLAQLEGGAIALGADLVIHSTTKYLNGHSDVVGGAVVAAQTSDVEALAAWANITGTTGAPFDAYLTLRGLRTLFPRVQRQQANAMAVAALLAGHPLVAAVDYPGLRTHPAMRLPQPSRTASVRC